MPDFERITDRVRLYLASTPEELANAKGFIEGKSFARRQIAYMAVFFTVVGLTIYTIANAF